MAVTYGIDYPFRESLKGNFIKMTETPEEEIRANLLHLILTRRGTRYYLPDFGTRLYEYIFEPNDAITFGLVEDEIRTTVKKYIPNLNIRSITVTDASMDTEEPSSVSEEDDARLFRISDGSTKPHTAKVRIDYEVNNEPFVSSDFIIINI
jgi:phage baseplate assembly protein W